MMSVLHLERLSSCIAAVEADFSDLEQCLYLSEQRSWHTFKGIRKRLFSVLTARFGYLWGAQYQTSVMQKLLL